VVPQGVRLKREWLLGLLVVLCVAAVLTGTVSSLGAVAVPHLAVEETGGRSGKAADREEPTGALAASRLRASGPIIIDHTNTDLSQIADYWIEQAKDLLRVSYGHTSHGSQLVTGMEVLEASAPSGLYDFNTNGAVTPGVLSLADYTPSGDLGNPDRTSWADRTRTYLNGAGSNRNVVVWSWCGQVSSATQADIQTYLDLMNGLEQEYPDVTFVYMTGHLDGSGVEGKLSQRNEQMRQYCRDHNKVLFDFADIESYDPDGEEFLSRYADDGCWYSCGGGSCNWADEWCSAHESDPLCESCSCAHSEPLNCNLKARAFWWMLARIAGWPGPGESTPQKYPFSPVAEQGEVVTYTVEVRGLEAPPEQTIYLTDVIPSGLQYVPGSLDASAGVTNDAGAPTLRWSGALGSAPLVTVTYQVTVTTSGPGAATNTATLAVPGYDSAEHSSTLLVNPLAIHLPLGLHSY
jgi:uncharacterized repeat protein (TIGR01451 family)